MKKFFALPLLFCYLGGIIGTLAYCETHENLWEIVIYWVLVVIAAVLWIRTDSKYER